MLTQERLKELLHYDPDTGIFTWIKVNSIRVKIGSRAGYCATLNYRLIGIDGKRYKEHRLAWLYIHGKFPNNIDHINGDTSDNKISNLRECNHAQNMQNRRNKKNKHGLIGVSVRKQDIPKKWVAQLRLNGKKIYQEYFYTKEEAHSAYLQAKKRLHPYCSF